MSVMKVRYRTSGGAHSTAYTDGRVGHSMDHHGVDKHTDLPVVVRWTGREWVEVVPNAEQAAT